MLIRDEQNQRRAAQWASQEATLERTVEAEQNQLGVHFENEEWEWTTLNADLMRGRGMQWTQFEHELREVRPDITILDHPRMPMRCIYVSEDGKLEHIASYQRAWLPEHSIRSCVEDWEYDWSIMGVGGKGLNGRDFDGKSPAPNKRRVIKSWHEALRGWRTILLRLMADGVLTVTEVEAKWGKPSKADGPGYQNWQYYCHGIGVPAY